MRRLRLGILIVLTILVMVNCAGKPFHGPEGKSDSAVSVKKPVGLSVLPDWYMNPIEEDETYIFSVGSGKSQQMDTALEKARQFGIADLSKRIATNVQTVEQHLALTAGLAQDSLILLFYEYTSKTVAKNTLTGLTVSKRYTAQESNGSWLACVQVAKRKDTIYSELLDVIRNENELSTEFKASTAYEALEAMVGHPR